MKLFGVDRKVCFMAVLMLVSLFACSIQLGLLSPLVEETPDNVTAAPGGGNGGGTVSGGSDNGSGTDPGGGGQDNGGDTGPGENPGAKYVRVNGNRLEYGAGNQFTEVVLRGVCTGDLYHYKKFRINPPDFSYIAGSMNANAVRIAVHPNLWLNEKDANFAYLKENVAKALAANLFVMIDYHTIGFPDGYVEPLNDKTLGFAYNSSFEAAKQFWELISKEFRDGRILFELWNEPISRPDYRGSRYFQMRPYWEELIKIIRNNGNNNVCVAAGDYWTHDLRGIKNNLISDANTAYAWHIYPDRENSTARWEEALDGLYTVRPVLVTEWGFQLDDPGEVDYAPVDQFAAKLAADFFTKKQLHNFAWGYDPFYTPNMLVKSSYTSFSGYGQFVVNYLRACGQVRPES
ncbi:MAG: glycoside hydrolase family 5 protein [Treponema sp.]|jgi:hypothetical protein|nr:glycoside hydrolase family 5 protein [Treponema sp.]